MAKAGFVMSPPPIPTKTGSSGDHPAIDIRNSNLTRGPPCLTAHSTWDDVETQRADNLALGNGSGLVMEGEVRR